MYKLYVFSKLGLSLCVEQLKINMEYQEVFPKGNNRGTFPDPFYVVYVYPSDKTYSISEEWYSPFRVEADITEKVGYKATTFLNKRIKNFNRI